MTLLVISQDVGDVALFASMSLVSHLGTQQSALQTSEVQFQVGFFF